MTTIFKLPVAIGRHQHPAQAIARILGTVQPLPDLAPFSSWQASASS